MATKKQLSFEKAKQIGDEIGIDWNQLKVEQFRTGLELELGYGVKDPQSGVTDSDLYLTGIMVRAHLSENSRYYANLITREKEENRYWNNV